MKLFVLLFMLVWNCWAVDGWDSLRIRVGVSHSAAGIWVPKGKLKAKPAVIIWLHGGMQSGKCEKGFEAGLAALPWVQSKQVVVASPSVCRDQHWLTPNGLDVIESLLDSLDARFHFDSKKISLVGVSDGGFGVVAYSYQGKRAIAHRLLVSTFPGLWIPQNQINDVKSRFSVGSWEYLQGGKDQIFPADQAKPWIEEFCRQIPNCKLQWDSQGEHDMSWWVEHRSEWLRKAFAGLASS